MRLRSEVSFFNSTSNPLKICSFTARVSTYFFHLYDDAVVRDEDGQELPDIAAAHREAIRNARHIACAEILEGHLNLKHRIEVEDEHGTVIATVRFEDVLALEA